MMPTHTPDIIPTICPTLSRAPHIVGTSVGIMSGVPHMLSGSMATGCAGYGGHIVRCRVHDCEAR
jgi:hypothetical protein